MITLDTQNSQIDLANLSKYFDLIDRIPTRDFTGWLNLPEDPDNIVKEVQTYTQKNGKKFDHIIVCGIGGSSLGIITLQSALFPNSHCRMLTEDCRLTVLDNLDVNSLQHVVDTIEPEKTLVIIISKSGGTLETITQFLFFKKHFHPDLYRSNFIFITDPETGYLREVANKDGIPTFSIPQDVGGRFSVLTGLGLLPLVLMGKNPAKILQGASAMKKRCLEKSNNNPALQMAVATYKMFPKTKEECKPDDKEHPCRGSNGGIVAMMSYSDRLFPLALWYQQLLAESIGKTTEIGLTPLPLRGSTDQHSVLQLLQEGPNDKLTIFLDVEDPGVNILLEDIDDPTDNFGYVKGKTIHDILRTQLRGTAKALADDGRPNLTICVPEINEQTMGELFFLLQMQIAILGEMYEINAFDQPGVEKSKTITKKLLQES